MAFEKINLLTYLLREMPLHYLQWLKCNGSQGNAVHPPPIYYSKRSPTSDCYNASERHTTIVRGRNLNVAFPHFCFCTLTTDYLQFIA